MDTPSDKRQLLSFDTWVDAWEWIWDRCSNITMYSNTISDASFNAAAAYCRSVCSYPNRYRYNMEFTLEIGMNYDLSCLCHFLAYKSV